MRTPQDFKQQVEKENISKWDEFEIREGNVFINKNGKQSFSSFKEIANKYNQLKSKTTANKHWKFNKRAKK